MEIKPPTPVLLTIRFRDSSFYRFPVPRSPFPVPRSPFPVPRSSSPVPLSSFHFLERPGVSWDMGKPREHFIHPIVSICGLQKTFSKLCTLGKPANMPGYNLATSDKESIHHRYLCNSCGLLLREAMQTVCGHFYCKSCLGNLFT